MSKYVQGFICAVPTANINLFTKHADQAAQAFRERGCLSTVECWGDDVPNGELTSFPLSVMAREDESVVFAWYIWPDKSVHDSVMKGPWDDPRLDPATNPMPFDGKRVIYGGFEPILELGAPRPGGYIDAFIAPIPKTHRDAFLSFAQTCDTYFMEHGACWIQECLSVDIPEGKLTDFKRAVKATPDEDILFSWVQWPSREARDTGNAKIMSDPRMSKMNLPFDGKRLIFGGFKPVVEAY
jgi:uncharacterized protein YbaA (DUF1428 family)